MWSILFFAVLLSGAGIVTYMHITAVKYYNTVFEEVARILNLEFKKGNALRFPEISGGIDEVQVKVKQLFGEEGEKFALTVNLIAGMKFPSDCRMSKEKNSTMLRLKVGIKDIDTGDERFDEEILLEGDSSKTLIAFLDVKTRRAIADLAVGSDEFVIERTGISARIGGREQDVTVAALVRLIRAMAAAARLLSREISLEERFAENILLDPIPRVRINNVRAMTSHPLLETRNTDVLEKALDNSSVEVQIEAAKHLKEEGMKHLVKVLDIRGNALKKEVFDDVLRTLKQNHVNACIPVLEKLYRNAKDEDFKKIILNTFTAFGDTGLHAFLLAELETDNPELQADIIAALGACGRVEAVEKLLKISNKTVNPFTRQRINEAVERIQSRLGNVEKGWLSVAQLQNGAGALSLAGEAEAGALSLSEQSEQKQGTKI